MVGFTLGFMGSLKALLQRIYCYKSNCWLFHLYLVSIVSTLLSVYRNGVCLLTAKQVI